MTSPTPLLYNMYYHIYNRGVNRENIFIEDRNFDFFLSLYIKYIEPVAETFAYCLLSNHFHMLVRIKSEEEMQALKIPLPTKDPSGHFSDFFNAYAKAINKAYGRTGSLFQHPFGRVPITSDAQLSWVVIYIHQNPRKHGFLDDFRNWKYSSYRTMLSQKATHLKRDEELAWFGGGLGFIQAHELLVSQKLSTSFAPDDLE